MKLAKHRLTFCLLAALVLTPILFYSKGYRLSSEAAVEGLRFTQPVQKVILLKEPASDELDFYLVRVDDLYYTVYSARQGFLWRAQLGIGSNRPVAAHSTGVELLTKYWLDDAKTGWLIVVSHDEAVSQLEITYGELKLQQKLPTGQPTVVFVPSSEALPFSRMDTGFYAAASSEDGTPLYELSYPIRGQTVYTEEYGWYPVA